MSVFVIAEAGINHGGDLQEAMRLIMAAKRAGADAVKFQHFSSQRLWGDDRIARYELTVRQLEMLKEHADAQRLEFMCTAFDVQSLTEVLPLVKRIKISSGCITDGDLLDAVVDAGLPVIASTGMADAQEVGRLVYDLGGVADLTLLQCSSIYPCPVNQVNLHVMRDYALDYGVPYGLSDHTTTVSVPIAAAALGAAVIEKHLTLDRNAEGPDHIASIEPQEFRSMVHGIRQVEAALGDYDKRVLDGERDLREAWRDKR